MVEDPEAALLAAVHANPEDEQARAVYADWLEDRGDPRGEYLRLELQRVTIPRRLDELVAQVDPDWIRMIRGLFRIWITSYGDTPIQAIKVVRELTGMSLGKAKELVLGVSNGEPAQLFDAVELERAREVVKYCEGSVALRVEPALPGLASVGPRVRRYRVLLVSVTDVERLIDALSRDGRSEEESHAITTQIAAGNAYELAADIESRDAAELASEFGRCAVVRTERVIHDR